MGKYLYDLEKLMDTQFGKDALKDVKLYKQVVNHRATNFHLGYVNYKNHHPSTIVFTPSAENIKTWEDDYKDMRENFIYGENKLSFEELMGRMNELTHRLRNMEIENNIIESYSSDTIPLSV